MVGKDGAAPYRGGRSAKWIKVRADRTDEFVVVGFTAPKRGRGGFGALHVAAYDGDDLVYCGRVGTGYDARQLDEIRAQLDAIVLDEPPLPHPPSGRDTTWVEPELVIEVRYKEITDDGLLRHPVFLARMRTENGSNSSFTAGPPGRSSCSPATRPT